MKSHMLALGRLKIVQMNKTEAEYARSLEFELRAGLIAWFKFEGIKLRLADNTFYTPDFFVMTADGQLEAHEVKGFMTDDAAVKIKVAAEMYPIRFLLVRKENNRGGGEWIVKDYSGSKAS